MGTEEPKDLLKGVDWKTVGGGSVESSVGPVVKKRLPKKIRQVPDYYFLPRRSIPSAIALYGTICAAGVGAGMLVEMWIDKKIKGMGRARKTPKFAVMKKLVSSKALRKHKTHALGFYITNTTYGFMRKSERGRRRNADLPRTTDGHARRRLSGVLIETPRRSEQERVVRFQGRGLTTIAWKKKMTTFAKEKVDCRDIKGRAES